MKLMLEVGYKLLDHAGKVPDTVSGLSSHSTSGLLNALFVCARISNFKERLIYELLGVLENHPTPTLSWLFAPQKPTGANPEVKYSCISLYSHLINILPLLDHLHQHKIMLLPSS